MVTPHPLSPPIYIVVVAVVVVFVVVVCFVFRWRDWNRLVTRFQLRVSSAPGWFGARKERTGKREVGRKGRATLNWENGSWTKRAGNTELGKRKLDEKGGQYWTGKTEVGWKGRAKWNWENGSWTKRAGKIELENGSWINKEGNIRLGKIEGEWIWWELQPSLKCAVIGQLQSIPVLPAMCSHASLFTCPTCSVQSRELIHLACLL